MTPEVGTSTDGFWPLQSRIMLLAASTLSQNIYFRSFMRTLCRTGKNNLDNEKYNAGESGYLKVDLKNKGLMNAKM
ncbi:MAG: hypothetical protein R3A12_05365 [Ignavibacteria bacterium]